MKWEDLPARSSITLGKADIAKLHGNPTKTFIYGMVTGAIALAVIQGCQAADSSTNTPHKGTKPTPSATATVNR